MRGTDWQEVNRKITEFYNAIKECEFFFVRSGEETEYAEISKYGRLEKGYDTGQEWIETDWFIEFQIYMDKDFIIKHMNEEIFPDDSKESEILAQFAGDFSIYTYENDYFCDCWLRYYIGVSREVPADTVIAHINNNMMF